MHRVAILAVLELAFAQASATVIDAEEHSQQQGTVDEPTASGRQSLSLIFGVAVLVAATAALGMACVSRKRQREARIVDQPSYDTENMTVNPTYDGPLQFAPQKQQQQNSGNGSATLRSVASVASTADRPPMPLPSDAPATVQNPTLRQKPGVMQAAPILRASTDQPAQQQPSQPQPTLRQRPGDNTAQRASGNPHIHSQLPKAAQAEAVPEGRRPLPPTVAVRQNPSNAARPPVQRPQSTARQPTRLSAVPLPSPPATAAPTQAPHNTRDSTASRDYLKPTAYGQTLQMPGETSSDEPAPPPPPRRSQDTEVPPSPPPRQDISSSQTSAAEKAGAEAAARLPPQRSRYYNVSLDKDNNTDTKGLTSTQEVKVPDIVAELRDKQVNRDHLTLVAELGKGFFGSVFLAKYEPENKRPMAVAVKAMHTDQDFDDKACRLFLLEAQIMAEFKHPNLLHLIGVTTTEEPWCILTEVCEFGDLLSILRACEANDVLFSLDEKLLILAQIALGMSYLASKQFIHRDLAARNCLVASDATVKIGDFGMSRLLQTQKEYYRPSDADDAMPIRWMAVESLTKMKFSTKSDVWSYGVVCYEVFGNGTKPYGPMNLLVIQTEVEGGLRLEQPSSCPNDVYQLMRSMWRDDPEQRPPFHEIYNTLSNRYRAERKRTVSARDLPKVIRGVLRGHLSEEEDPYKLFKKREAEARARQQQQQQQQHPQAERMADVDDDNEDEDYSDGYKDLDGTQMEYVDATHLPQEAAVPEEPKATDYVYESLSRAAAERMLLSQGRQEDIQGLFLLRRSSNGRDLSLSAVKEDAVVHFRVQSTPSGFKIMGGVYADAEELVLKLRFSRKVGIPLVEYITRFNQVA